MNALTYFILWEVVLVLFVAILYCFLSKNNFKILHLIYLSVATLVCGYILFYDTFEIHTKIAIKKSTIRLDEKTREQYYLKIEEEDWIVDDWTKEGIQIGNTIYSLKEEVSTTILLNVSDNKEYEGERDLLVDGSTFLLEEVHDYNGVKFNIKQYTYYDGVAEMYGEEYYNPYYIISFEVNEMYYSIRIINDTLSEDMMYMYGTTNIRNKDLEMYLEYIESIIKI